MTAFSPTFFLGDSDEASGHTFPLASVTSVTLTLGTVTPVYRRRYASAPLYQRATSSIDDQTPTRTLPLDMTLIANGETQGLLHRACLELESAIGTGKANLWIADDAGSVQGVVNTGADLSGSGRTINYTPDATAWLANGDFMYFPDTTSGESEVVVVGSLTSSAFVADLQVDHLAGNILYRPEIVYPNAVCVSIQPSRAPIGKGGIRLQWLVEGTPLTGTTLPADAS